MVRLLLMICPPLLLLGSTAFAVEIIGDKAGSSFLKTGFSLLNLFPAAVVIGAAFLVPAWYLDRLYDLGGILAGAEYLFISVFGQIGTRPWLVVREGALQGDLSNTIVKVGGPGLLVVYNDSAVVTECRGALKRVLGPGYHRLKQFERVWEVVDLRPQRWVYPVSALTRDGIPISCEVDILFKIDDRPEGSDTPLTPTAERPHPFTDEAVLRAATATRVREEKREDQMMKWTGRVVIGEAEGTLRSLLSRFRLDQLVRPGEKTGENPFWKEIREQLERELSDKARKVGARIISVGIGQVDIRVSVPEEETAKALRDEVLDQWIRTWQAELERDMLTLQAEGEAALAGLEAVDIQAKAEMVLTLIEAIETIATREHLSAYQIALRFVETLRWMSFDPGIRAFVPLEPLRFLEKLHEAVERATLPRGTTSFTGGRERGAEG
jgi:regulator of protease activity HflC (stomatin/prohibitin superfamily)